MRIPWWSLVCVALSGCVSYCGGTTVITGEVRIAVDVDIDPSAFASLEIRGYATDDPAKPPDTEPSYTASIPITETDFPYEYILEEQRPSGWTVYLRAWLARDPHAPVAARAGEPYGKAVAEICACASDAPAYASDVVIVIDRVVPD